LDSILSLWRTEATRIGAIMLVPRHSDYDSLAVTG